MPFLTPKYMKLKKNLWSPLVYHAYQLPICLPNSFVTGLLSPVITSANHPLNAASGLCWIRFFPRDPWNTLDLEDLGTRTGLKSRFPNSKQNLTKHRSWFWWSLIVLQPRPSSLVCLTRLFVMEAVALCLHTDHTELRNAKSPQATGCLCLPTTYTVLIP